MRLADHLARRLGHNIKPLERDEVVARVVDELDRRSWRIGLTALGKRKLAAARKQWAVAQRKFETAFGVERARALREVLAVLASDKFAESFEQQPAD